MYSLQQMFKAKEKQVFLFLFDGCRWATFVKANTQQVR